MRSVVIIGGGRVGSALARAIDHSSWKVEGVLGRHDDPSGAAEGADLVVVATPDDAVADVAAAVRPDPHAVVMHLAGSLGLDVLAPHARRAAMHPLMALPDAELGAARLRAGGWFAIAGDAMADELVAELGGRAFAIDDQHRARYHAAAAIASNHLVALLGQAERIAATAGVPFDALMSLVESTVDNVGELGPRRALTGPAARGDHATIDRHLQALPADERELYRALVAEAQQLARSGDES